MRRSRYGQSKSSNDDEERFLNSALFFAAAEMITLGIVESGGPRLDEPTYITGMQYVSSSMMFHILHLAFRSFNRRNVAPR